MAIYWSPPGGDGGGGDLVVEEDAGQAWCTQTYSDWAESAWQRPLSLRSLLPNSSRTSTVFQERMRTFHSNGPCTCPSIVELTAWNCGYKVVGAGHGGHQRRNKPSSWRRSPTGLGRDQVTARKVECYSGNSWSKILVYGKSLVLQCNKTRLWLASKQFWQTVRQLRRGKWRPTYMVWSAGGMLLTSTTGIVTLAKEYFEDLLNPAVVLCCTHLCSIWRRHSTTLGYPVGGASAIWRLLLVSDPLLSAIWSLYHSKSLVWVRLLGDSGYVWECQVPLANQSRNTQMSLPVVITSASSALGRLQSSFAWLYLCSQISVERSPAELTAPIVASLKFQHQANSKWKLHLFA